MGLESLIGPAGSVASGLGNYFTGSKQADSIRKAMAAYMDYRQKQRDTFLNQPESLGARKTLGTWAEGKTGFEPTMLEGLKQNYYEDYGKGLTDTSRMSRAAAVNPGGTYTPGRGDRTSRIMGQNIATSRAEGIRDINQKNNQQALSNAQYAMQALPTYLPGDPSSGTITDPNVFAGAYNQGPSLAGSLLTSTGNYAQGMGSQVTASQYPSYPYYGQSMVAQNQLYGNQGNPMMQRFQQFPLSQGRYNEY